MGGEVRIQPVHRRIEVARVLARLVRMNPDGEPHPVPGRLDRLRPLRFRIVTGGQNHQCARQPRLASARHHGVEIGGEFLAGEMTVRIDHHRTRVPGGTS